MNEINIEKIMDEIRAQIPEQEEGWAELRFEDVPVENGTEGLGGAFDKRELDRGVMALSACTEVEFFRPVPGGSVKSFVKRVLRKLIRFCIEPICQDISRFHRASASALRELRRFVTATGAAHRRQEEELALLRAEVETLRARVEELERRA